MTLHNSAPAPTTRIDVDPTWLARQLSRAKWRSASTGGTNCVEIARLACEITAVRDSVNPDRQPLILSDRGFEQVVNSAAELCHRPLPLDSNAVSATTKNDLHAGWLTGQLDSADWKFGGSESIGVAVLPRGITAFCNPRDQGERQHLIFAQPEIDAFLAGIGDDRFQR
ncbi:DUF397 domain-containing protein [Kitasatospora sp. NPDC051984]|uniref:DUF397 domain-containing protein n=1 Tax=Kitasatospora sp. NPDC051984 TaxID=3364059 RepID=UPI0037C52289